ncbi:hypothetical protein OG874_19250 [Nocardia sp. NBC_00565]|uniref:hypothetical protein n=1 Tax=Nocardia sp. NBC_00565 TaxID=2975993 RepID=UPI002E81736E|nr:hypothetical protein [Nocardia sp. NBC_00565]WUC07102.1 hypothetical protein OG874_19250 [Nocardia sp. NBC_00565]
MTERTLPVDRNDFPAPDFSAPALELRTVIDDELVGELHAAAGTDDDLEQLREQLSGPHFRGVVMARHRDRVIGWVTLVDPGGPDNYLIAMPVVEPGYVDLYRTLLTAALEAADAASHAGIQWIAQHRDGEQVAAELRATRHQDLDRAWHIEIGPWPELPSAHVEKLPVPPSPVTLVRYAELYTAAGLTRCDGTDCTDHWDASSVTALLADRDEFLRTTFSLGYIDPDGALLAECSVGISDATARLSIVHATEQPAELAALLRGTLYRLHAHYPDVRTAEVAMNPHDEPLELALTATGFTVCKHTVEYRIPVPDKL